MERTVISGKWVLHLYLLSLRPSDDEQHAACVATLCGLLLWGDQWRPAEASCKAGSVARHLCWSSHDGDCGQEASCTPHPLAITRRPTEVTCKASSIARRYPWQEWGVRVERHLVNVPPAGDCAASKHLFVFWIGPCSTKKLLTAALAHQ